MSKHTPGPWGLTKEFGDTLVCSEPFQDKTDGEHIATMREGRDADARLIAAAPSMYDLLDTILAYSENRTIELTPSLFDELKRVLAKARGE